MKLLIYLGNFMDIH